VEGLLATAPKLSDMQRAGYGQTVTGHYFSVVDLDCRFSGAA